MPFYTENLIEEIRSKNNIADVISGYVRLQKKGSTYFGLCPFHSEKTPSFSVTPGKQMYYCFGCGAGGDVFHFLMEYENFTFFEAVEELAKRAGVALPKGEDSINSSKGRIKDYRRQKLLEIHKEAGKFYYMLLRSEHGRAALDYFQMRGLSGATMQRFGLGYSDKSGNGLYRYLKNKGYDDGLLKESGLVAYSERGGGYDKFRGRTMFPIMDARGKVIGFGGRVMDGDGPKYLNSPETEIFDKSRNLYGINLAKASRQQQFLLCEGYMDVIALHQAGFDNAAASLGTAFTSGHASLLKRYTKEVCLAYDSDDAGIRAALRAIPILKEAGITAKVIDMSPYKDPDEFIKALGAKAYRQRIEKAENSFLFEIRMLERQYDLGDPEGKTLFYNEAARKLLGFTEELERENYIEAVASKYRIGFDNLRKLVFSIGAKETALPRKSLEMETHVRRQKKKEDGMKMPQKMLLTWLIEHPSLFLTVSRYIRPKDFTEEVYRSAAEALYGQCSAGEGIDAGKILGIFEEAADQKEIAALFHAQIPDVGTKEGMEKALKETMVKIMQNSIRLRSLALAPTDLLGLQQLVEDKRKLEQLEKLHISIE